jgi:uncharacterized protein
MIAYPLLLLVLMTLFRLTGCAERLFYQPTCEPTPAPRLFAGARTVAFTSADGTALRGWFIPSQSSPPNQSPTIIQVHGNGGCINNHLGFVDYLPTAGFNLFMFDYRGYGESGGSAWGRAALIADAHAALDILLEQPEVNPERIGLHAQSLGGAIGMNLMAERPEIRAGVFESPFASWRLAAATALGGPSPNMLARFAAWLLISDERRPIDAIREIDRPMLILHGDADLVIPSVHSRQLHEAAPNSSKFIELPGGEHNTLRDTHPEMERWIGEFYEQHLSL